MLNSPVDIALLFGAALLLFGPKKLPEIGKALGQGIGNFKRSLTSAQDEFKSAMKTDEPGQEGGATITTTATAKPSNLAIQANGTHSTNSTTNSESAPQNSGQ
jgi:sec-independent protein translocase protein TatA